MYNPYSTYHHHISISCKKQHININKLLKSNTTVHRAIFFEMYPVVKPFVLDSDVIELRHDETPPTWYINTGLGMVVIEPDNVYTLLNGEVSELRGIASDHDSFIAVQALELQRLTVLKELLA